MPKSPTQPQSMLSLPMTAMSMRETFITTTSKPPRLFRCSPDTYPEYACRLNQLKPTKPKTSTIYRFKPIPQPFTASPTPHSAYRSNPTPFIRNPIHHHKPQTRTLRTSTEHQNNPTKTHVTRHYPLQHQLEHGTTNRLLLHLLIRHIILSNHLLHSATRCNAALPARTPTGARND